MPNLSNTQTLLFSGRPQLCPSNNRIEPLTRLSHPRHSLLPNKGISSNDFPLFSPFPFFPPPFFLVASVLFGFFFFRRRSFKHACTRDYEIKHTQTVPNSVQIGIFHSNGLDKEFSRIWLIFRDEMSFAQRPIRVINNSCAYVYAFIGTRVYAV